MYHLPLLYLFLLFALLEMRTGWTEFPTGNYSTVPAPSQSSSGSLATLEDVLNQAAPFPFSLDLS
jgi:hypothetical protein